MVQINWTNQVVLDLKEIAKYISRDSLIYAKIQIKRIKHRTNILKQNPFSVQKVNFFNSPEIRHLVTGNYIVIYKIKTETRINILAVHHSSRDLSRRKLEV